MKDIESARELSNIMIKIGKKYNREVVCFITDMETPLGNAIGNSLEVIESINTLKGNGPKDLTNLVLNLASHLISMDKGISLEEATRLAIDKLNDGSAYKKFVEFIESQEGDINDIKVSNRIFSVKSNKSGFVKKIDALKIGVITHKIGAGRTNKEDKIDHTVGIRLNKLIGDKVKKGDVLATLYVIDKVDLSNSGIIQRYWIDL